MAEICIVAVVGPGGVCLGRGTSPAWSPDGRKLVFIRRGDVWTIDADGTHARRITRFHADVTPDWQPRP
jgi:Tol biopolymer transport system component